MTGASVTSSSAARRRRQSSRSNLKQRKKKKTGRLVIAAVLVAMGLFYGLAYRGVAKLQRQLTSVNQEVSYWKHKNDQLERRVKYLKSEDYVESVARRELGLVKKGEILVVLSKDSGQQKQH